ncbi:MAG: hypothetical protein KatS3mg103_0217 [Phycisphaerales bacterium]|nr:MAG: hypothetical protein KatS3mg103_0217 [Phycisphaerales bacterium]
MVVAVCPLASVAVAVTVRVYSPWASAGGVNFRPWSWSAVSRQVPLPRSVPALRLAPSGTPSMVIERVSEPSVSVSAADRSSGIAASSLPSASWTCSVGASATAWTETFNGWVVVAVCPLASVAVAVTLRV